MAELGSSDDYIRGWTKEMLVIWREKIERYSIIRSGKLHGSLDSVISGAADGSMIEFAFLRYGIYQAFGVGNGYCDNGGDLEFLGSEYRREHKLDIPRKVGPAWGGYFTSGEARKKRDWIHPKLYSSQRVLAEMIAKILGETAAAAVVSALEGR